METRNNKQYEVEIVSLQKDIASLSDKLHGLDVKTDRIQVSLEKLLETTRNTETRMLMLEANLKTLQDLFLSMKIEQADRLAKNESRINELTDIVSQYQTLIKFGKWLFSLLSLAQIGIIIKIILGT